MKRSTGGLALSVSLGLVIGWWAPLWMLPAPPSITGLGQHQCAAYSANYAPGNAATHVSPASARSAAESGATRADYVPGATLSNGQEAESGQDAGSAASIQALLERKEALSIKLGSLRRAFFLSSRMKLTELDLFLQQIEQEHHRRSLLFYLDDRHGDPDAVDPQADAALVRSIRERERREREMTWQDPEQPSVPDPIPVSMGSLQGLIEREQRSGAWGMVSRCAGSLQRLEDLTRQVARASQARLDSLSEAALAELGKGRMRQLWQARGQWVEAWEELEGSTEEKEKEMEIEKDGSKEGSDPSMDPIRRFVQSQDSASQRQQHSEFAYWGLRFNLFWPVQGPSWFNLTGLKLQDLKSQEEGGGLWILEDLLSRVEHQHASRAAVLGGVLERLKGEMKAVSRAGRDACGLDDSAMQSLAWASGAPGHSFCSSERVTSERVTSGADMGSFASRLATLTTPLAPPHVWLRPWGTFRDGASTDSSLDAMLATTHEPPLENLAVPVSVSILMVLQWNITSLDFFKPKLWNCSMGLQGEGELGGKERLSMEVLLAVDSLLCSHFRDQVVELIGRVHRPDFAVRVVYVTTGAAGLSLARGFNILSALARGEVLLVQEAAGELWSKDCDWLMNLVRPFRAWPRLGASGGFWGKMSTFNVPGASQLDVTRYANKPKHNRLFDPEQSMNFQFLLGTAFGPMALSREALSAVGGFDEEAVGASDMILDFDLCRRLWLAGFQVGMPALDKGFLRISHRLDVFRVFYKNAKFASQEPSVFGKDTEDRIVAEVRRMNRYLKPVTVWEW